MSHLIECASYTSQLLGLAILDITNTAPVAQPGQIPAALKPVEQRPSVVYYVRIGDHIKIGTTVDIRARLKSLYVDTNPDALLATEPGDRHLESERHREYAAERVYQNRELFNPSRRLMAHIENLARRSA